MLALLAKFFTSGIVTEIAAAYRARENAKTDSERIAADERIARLESIRDIQKSEAGSRINAIMRAAIAAPVAVLLWKVFVWDKAFGQWTNGRTDALSPELWNVVTAVIGFYFVFEFGRILKGK